jgi:uncharacterized protein with von Willebrand factor type A (vWA) domain
VQTLQVRAYRCGAAVKAISSGKGGLLVYPARFEYFAPTTLEEACELLDRFEGEAKVLAGGQSLIPLMKLRFAAPQALVDINSIAGLRRSRRRRAARRGAPDLRRTLRRSFRTAGEPIERAWRERRLQPRRLVLLLDVSGSMADYSRALVMFAHAALRANPRWEAFCFGTRLTRVTRPLRSAGHDEALRRAAAEVVDWDGGTRIGESLKGFLDEFGHRGMARGAVVVLCSDGLEVGDPELLGEQMARLSRLAHRVVWLNPLQEDPAYEPLARGMKAALPYVDDFSGGHNLATLEAVAERLARSTAR